MFLLVFDIYKNVKKYNVTLIHFTHWLFHRISKFGHYMTLFYSFTLKPNHFLFWLNIVMPRGPGNFLWMFTVHTSDRISFTSSTRLQNIQLPHKMHNVPDQPQLVEGTNLKYLNAWPLAQPQDRLVYFKPKARLCYYQNVCTFTFL